MSSSLRRTGHLLAAFALVACGAGSAGAPRGSSSTSSGGAGAGGGGGGGGGSGPVVGSAKPVCDNPGTPAGSAPLPRADTAGVLANDGRTFLLFGGDTALPVCGQIPARKHVGDTWLLDAGCGVWTEVTGLGPTARARHAMALDAVRDRAILFGGRTRAGGTGPYTLFADVWAFDFKAGQWSALTTTGTGPSARSNAATAVSGDRLIVFGGNSATDGTTFAPESDTYALDLVSRVWTKLAPAGAHPAARLFHAMAADPTAARVYVYAGGDANAFVGPFFTDVWSLDLGTNAWTKRIAKSDVGRIKLGLAARAPEGGAAGPLLYAFGGHDDGALGNRNDVVSADLGASSPAFSSVRVGDVPGAPASGACMFPADFTKPDLASPERRSAFAFGARADGTAFVVVGGDSDCGRLDDAWWFDTAAGAWTPIKQTPPGLSCPRTGSAKCSGLCG